MSDNQKPKQVPSPIEVVWLAMLATKQLDCFNEQQQRLIRSVLGKGFCDGVSWAAGGVLANVHAQLVKSEEGRIKREEVAARAKIVVPRIVMP